MLFEIDLLITPNIIFIIRILRRNKRILRSSCLFYKHTSRKQENQFSQFVDGRFSMCFCGKVCFSDSWKWSRIIQNELINISFFWGEVYLLFLISFCCGFSLLLLWCVHAFQPIASHTGFELSLQVSKIEACRWLAIHDRTILTWRMCCHPQAEVLLWRRDGETCPPPSWSFTVHHVVPVLNVMRYRAHGSASEKKR